VKGGLIATIRFILPLPVWRTKWAESLRVKYWEIIADNLSKAGWSWDCVSAIDSNGPTIWIADAHRDDRKRFVVRADEKLTALVELESRILVASGKLERLLGVRLCFRNEPPSLARAAGDSEVVENYNFA
jgi:hypothetical protein